MLIADLWASVKRAHSAPKARKHQVASSPGDRRAPSAGFPPNPASWCAEVEPEGGMPPCAQPHSATPAPGRREAACPPAPQTGFEALWPQLGAGLAGTGGRRTRPPPHLRAAGRGGAAAARAAGRGVGAGRVPRRPAQGTEPAAQHPGAEPVAAATAVREGPRAVMASRGARPSLHSQRPAQ